jgi:TP901 family phage tail tape measure protein
MNAKLLQLIIQLKDEASAALGKLQGTLSSVGGFLSGAFTAAVVGAGIAIAGLAAGSLTAAADFETATANFASVAGGSLAEAGFALDDVKSKALELGAVTQFSAGQAQDAMIALAKGGVPVVDIMGDATAAALDLAAAGSLELGPAADIVAKQLGVWANTGVNAAQVANLMAQAANASTIDVDELALGLANVGGVAKVSGVSFQDLNQTMALIAPGFASAADAGTSLKTFLLSLGGSSTSAIDAMKSLGLVSIDYAAIADDLGIAFDGTQKSAAALDEAILRTIDAQAGANRSTKEWKDAYAAFLQDFTTNAFYDQAGQMKDMGAVAQILQDSLAGLSEEEKTAALNAIFGSDAYRAAAFIAEAGASGFDAMGQAMTAAGTAAEQAAVKNKTFAFAWDSLKGSIETVQIIIGSALLPLLTDLTNTVLIPAVNGVMALASALTTSNDPWATFVGMLNSALPGLGSFVDFVATNVLPILSAIGAMILAAIVPAFWAWAAAAIPAAAATIAATLPLIAIISAIGLAVGLLVAAWQNNWGGIQEKTAAVWAFVQPVLQQLWNWLGVQLVAAAQTLAAFWTGTLWPALMVVGSWLATNIPVAIAAVVAGFQLVGTIASAVWTGIVTTITTVAGQVGAAINVVVTVVTAAWNTIRFVTSAVWGAIGALIGPPLAQAGAAVSSAVATITGAVSSGWATVQSATAGPWAAVQAVISGVVATVQGAVAGAVAAVTGAITSGWAAVQSATAGPWAAVQAIIAGVITAIKTTIGAGVAAAKEVVLAAWAVLVAASHNRFGEIPAIISGAWDRIKSLFADGVAGVRDALLGLAADAGNIASAIVSGVVRGISNGIGSVINAAKNLAQSAYDAAMGALDAHSPSRLFEDVGDTVPAGMVLGIDAGMPKVGASLSDGIADITKDARSKAGNAGKHITTGLANGITAGMPAVNKSLISGIAGLSESAAKALEAGSQAIAAANAYSGGAGLGAFLSDFTQLALQFNAAAVALGGQILGTATRFADTIGKISEPISKAVEALQGLNDLTMPSIGAISAFTATLAVLLSMLTATAASVDARGLAAAVQLAAAADKILAVVKSGVEAFAALNTYVQPVPGQVTAFTGKLNWLIQQFVDAGTWLQGAGLAAGVQLAAAADKILAVVKSGVEAFAALNTYVQPVPGQVTAFTGKLNWLIQQFVDAGAWLRGPGLAAGVALADAAGKILGIIGSGVDAFAKLAIFAPIPQWAITAFGQALQATLVVLIAIATTWAQAAIDRAAVFADGAGKSIAIIGSGVEGFTKLATFQGVPQAAIDAFGQALNAALTVIEYISATWIQAAIDRAAVFADGAGKSIAIIGSGVEGFTKLATFQGVPQAAIDAFGQALNAALTVIEYISATWIQAAIDRAAVFAEGAGKTIAIIGGGVDGFIKLASFQGVPEAAFTALGQALNQALVVIDDLSATWASTGLERAVAWAQAVDTIAKTITGAIDTISKLGQLQNGAAGLLDTFAATLTGMLAEMQRIAVPATQTLGQQMSWGIAQGIEAGTPAIVQAVYAAMNAALAAARAALGIASPSTVFDEDIGQMGGAGMARGFDRSAPMVAAAASRMAGAAVVPAQAALRPVAAPVGGGGAAAPAPAAASQISVIFQSGAIVQQPGESGEALANRVVTLLEERIRLRGL